MRLYHLFCIALLAFVFEAGAFDGEKSFKGITKVVQGKKVPQESLKNLGHAFPAQNANRNDLTNDICMTDALKYGEIKSETLEPIERNLVKGGASGLASVSGFPLKTKAVGERGGIKIFDLRTAKGGSSFDEYIKQFASIASADIKIYNVSVNPDHRSPSDVRQFHTATVDTGFDIRGTQKGSGLLRQDRIRLHLSVEREKSGPWTIKSARFINGESLIGKGSAGFKDVTSAVGLANVPVQLRTEAIRRGGYALGVTDFNRDGQPDVFVGLRDGAYMYQGTPTGFKKVDIGLEKEIYVKTAVFADYDGDGFDDVIITRFTPQLLKRDGSPEVDVVLYMNDRNGKFALAKSQPFGAENKRRREPMPAAVADFNGDGFLDFYIGYPGARDFSAVYDVSANSKTSVQGLYINDGKGGLLNKTESNLDYHNVPQFRSKLYPHSSIAVDFDQDGDVDIIVSDDRGNLSPVYVNQGKGVFKQSAEKIGIGNFGFAMTVAVGDYNNDGITDIAMTNVVVNEMIAANAACESNWGRSFINVPSELRLFRGTGNGSFVEVTEAAGLTMAGFAHGGLQFVDYDNDGHQDIYVVNGLWSGTQDGPSLGFLFAAGLRHSDSMYPLRSRDSMKFMDVLGGLSGLLDYRTLSWSPKPGVRPSLGGFQKNRLYRNNGDGTFTETAYFEGLDIVGDGYIVGRADLDKDGRIDLILRNADPGAKENVFAPVQLLRSKSSGRGVTLALKNASNQTDAIGSFAIAEVGGVKSVHHLVGNNGSMQEERIIHVGLGKRNQIDRLIVHWASGQMQEFKGLKPGHHVLTEKRGHLSDLNR